MKKHSGGKGRGTFFQGTEDKKSNIGSMRRYVRHKQELDKKLEELISPVLKKGLPMVLDACCGLGHLIYHLQAKFPNAQFVGVDQTTYLIDEAKKLLKDADNVRFETGDLYRLPKRFKKAFDVTICWKTLTWLPHYEDALSALITSTRSHLFISSLFYDGDIDYEIKVREYAKERGVRGSTYHNIYSLPRFERFARSLGAKKVRVMDFKIGIDLPRGPIDHMGTYTLRLKDGTRMQMSGALPMPWKIIHIEL